MEKNPAAIAQNIFKTADKVAQSTDGFENFAAKLGVSPRGCEGDEQNVLSDGKYQFNIVTRNRIQLEAAYRGSWVVGKVIDVVAEDMTRAGVIITTTEQADKIAEIQTKLSQLQVWQSLCDHRKWSRLYGGAIGVLQIKGQKLDTPLDPETIQQGQFQGITVYDRWQLNPDLTNLIDSGPELGLPKYYNIVLGNNLNDPSKAAVQPGISWANGQVRVHHSRCIRGIGIQLPFFQSITEMMWGESILERLWDRLISFDTATMSTANLINRAQLRTVGVDGLREILSAGGAAEQALLAQFKYMRMFQVNEGLTLLDKEDTFASTAYSFAGLSDVLLQFGQQLSGATDIPLVRLFGQSPAGLSATGEADMRMYYDGINAQQEANLRNPIEMVLKVLWRSCFGVATPKDLKFVFTPLWQMSAVDKAAIAKSNTETIMSAHAEGAVSLGTAMKELRQMSGDVGLFSNISDEEIEEAENDEPPMPGVEAESEEQKSQPDKLASHTDKEKKDDKEAKDAKPVKVKSIDPVKAKDSAWKKFLAWLDA